MTWWRFTRARVAIADYVEGARLLGLVSHGVFPLPKEHVRREAAVAKRERCGLSPWFGTAAQRQRVQQERCAVLKLDGRVRPNALVVRYAVATVVDGKGEGAHVVQGYAYLRGPVGQFEHR